MEQGWNGKQAPTNPTTLVLNHEGKAAGVPMALSSESSNGFKSPSSRDDQRIRRKSQYELYKICTVESQNDDRNVENINYSS